MVDRVEASVEEGIKDPTMPPEGGNAENEMILGKFKSYEDLEKAYKNLESKLGERAAPEDPTPLPPQPRAEDEWQQDENGNEDYNQPNTDAEIKAALPGFTNDQVEEISRYAWENRELTDDHYESLERAGYSREIVDNYMAGQFAMAEAAQSQLINAGGGEERVQAMFDWAATNLDQGTVDAYNAKFEQGGPDAIMAMEALAAKYDASGEGTT